MEIIFDYIREAEDDLTEIYRRLGAYPPPPADEIQRDIANVVVLLYGLRREGAEPSEPHPLVFANRIGVRAEEPFSVMAAAD